MNEELFHSLIAKVENGTATREELSRYNAYMNRLTPGHSLANNDLDNEGATRDELWGKIQSAITPPEVRVVKWPRLLRVAAVLLLGVAIGMQFLLPALKPEKKWHAQIDRDIKPVGNSATLTLAGGKKIILSNAVNGVLAIQQNAVIQQSVGGQISYSGNDIKKAGPAAYDTLTTPAGAVYSLKLADGSTVWLNAGTSLRFPEAFAANGRDIKLLYGEAYFEVAHQANAPFRVYTPKGTVEDIGTHFNINAYADGPVEKTTLLEGSIRVIPKAYYGPVVLVPGQQAQLNGSTIKPLTVTDDVDMDEAVAWKNGLFLFNNEKLGSIMQKICSWYNVKVTYKSDAVKNEVFLGSIPRLKNISEVMEMLERTGNSHFELKDNVILIKPKK